MKIRNIKNIDCMDLFNWKNHINTPRISIEQKLIPLENHKKWFFASLRNQNRDLFIGEIGKDKIGLCRFDYNSENDAAEISINLNPLFRGKGYEKKFLLMAIKEYLKKRVTTLIAKVKIDNSTNFNLFSAIGFKTSEKLNGIIKMEMRKSLKFKEVNYSDVDLLYDLIEKRNYSISHQIMPSYENHQKFVKNNPYLNWYLIFLNEKILGTFYIKDDNSIGININNFTKSIIEETLYFITKNFNPQESVPSVIPKYFYINVPSKNIKLIETLNSIGLINIAVSFKIE